MTNHDLDSFLYLVLMISTTFCILLEGLLEENERLTRMLEQELWRQPMVIHVKPERFEELLQQARPEADK